jgi:RNA polymerase sigma-70 factor (ECF subfamily)
MQAALQASMIHLDARVHSISELDDIDALVRIYRPRILRFVICSISDVDLAESITQDCFLKAYAGRASFRGDCAVSTWLFGIANNLIRDHYRSKKFQFWRKARATAVDAVEMADYLPNMESSPEKRILAKEQVAKVAKAVEHLSVNQRKVFLLKFIEEIEVTDIAEMTGMPLNTVKTHLRRAVLAVRANLRGKP